MNYNHLTWDERYHIEELKREGFCQAEIAKKLGRSRATISRELRRNIGERGYRTKQAHEKAQKRLSERGSSNVKRINRITWDYVTKHLIEGQWSPEQICGRLRLQGLGAISPETIYQKILADKREGGQLYLNLRCKKQRRKRYGSNRMARGIIKNRVDIDERPAIVDQRKRIGDWEGDTVIGSHTRGPVIATLVERKSRFTKCAKANDKTSEAVTRAIFEKMKPLAAFMLTMTLDNGREFSSHQTLAALLKIKIFFAHPYHSWERGTNENTNGLLRQYLPKKTSFHNLTEEALQKIEDKLNNRPRKCLGYQTPFEVFSKHCQKQGVSLSF
jgi:transposase, IS30 family